MRRAARTLPPAGLQRLARLLRGAVGEQTDQSGLQLPSRGGEGGAAAVLVQPGGLHHDVEDPAAQLVVGGGHIDHQVRVRPALRHHHGRGQVVEHHLVRGGGLQPGGARDRLRTGVHPQVDVHLIRQLGPGVGADQCGEGTRRPSGAQGAADVGSAAAGGDADRDVARPHLGSVGRPDGLLVLDALHRFDQCAQSTRVMGDDDAGREAVGGDQLGGVHHREAARRARAEVVQPAAGPDPARRLVHQPSHVGQYCGDGLGRDPVLGVEQTQHLQGGHVVDVASAGVTAFGGGVDSYRKLRVHRGFLSVGGRGGRARVTLPHGLRVERKFPPEGVAPLSTSRRDSGHLGPQLWR